MTLSWKIDAKGVWEIDRAHFSTPVSGWFRELMGPAFAKGFAECTERIGLLLSHFDFRFPNGMPYMQPVIVGAPRGAKGLPPKSIFKLLCALHPAMRKRLKTLATAFERKPWLEDVKRWETEIRPTVTALHLELQRADPAALDDAALAAWLQKLYANALEQYTNHHRFTVSSMLPVGDYISHCEEWTGLDAGTLLQAVRQPSGVTTIAGQQLTALVDALHADPAAAKLLVDEEPGEALRPLAARDGVVGIAARTYLEMTARRLVTGYDVVDLTAIEMPGLIVRTLKAQLAGIAGEAADQRAARAAEVRDKVPAQHRAMYDELLAAALAVSNLREERALVCDFWAFGIARGALQELGRRLALRGTIAEPDHVFDATLAEQLALFAGKGPSASELADRNRHRKTVTCDDAPQFIGGEPSPPPPLEWMPPAVQRSMRATNAVITALFGEAKSRHEPSCVRGLNASAGTYEGRARRAQARALPAHRAGRRAHRALDDRGLQRDHPAARCRRHRSRRPALAHGDRRARVRDPGRRRYRHGHTDDPGRRAGARRRHAGRGEARVIAGARRRYAGRGGARVSECAWRRS